MAATSHQSEAVADVCARRWSQDGTARSSSRSSTPPPTRRRKAWQRGGRGGGGGGGQASGGGRRRPRRGPRGRSLHSGCSGGSSCLAVSPPTPNPRPSSQRHAPPLHTSAPLPRGGMESDRRAACASRGRCADGRTPRRRVACDGAAAPLATLDALAAPPQPAPAAPPFPPPRPSRRPALPAAIPRHHCPTATAHRYLARWRPTTWGASVLRHVDVRRALVRARADRAGPCGRSSAFRRRRRR